MAEAASMLTPRTRLRNRGNPDALVGGLPNEVMKRASPKVALRPHWPRPASAPTRSTILGFYASIRTEVGHIEAGRMFLLDSAAWEAAAVRPT